MGLLGGSRIDGITIFLAVTLVLYTILVAGVYATFTDVGFVDPYSGKVANLEFSQEYENNAIENATLGDWTEFTDLDPNSRLYWSDAFIGEDWFQVNRYGTNWWDGWLTYTLNPDQLYVSDVLDQYDTDLNYTKVVFDLGGDFETAVYFCPLFYFNDTSEEVTYIDDALNTSIDNGVISVVMATNASYSSYDIGQVMGALVGFSTYDIPMEIAVITGGIFWVLLILLLVKLVVG